ncbi:SET and MYND domain-containing protein DDB_G0273589 [Culex quinquefasciatus]|uniref:SET and MYND domain-containing protein DDB_G0273589 n=1 Tax=Culex quinquefasciatus TaxID=7176 RepID=UPI0018E3155B|nr:SET and MYND domain-containing protein DDB_G0273589 [Culex quinquefasciatus]
MTNFHSEFDAKCGRGYATLMNQIRSQFGEEFGMLLDVTLYRDYALKQRDIFDIPEQGKCDEVAAKLRQQGNRLYMAKKYEEALKKYNESLCFAEAGSEQVGMGFANRSAVYHEQGEFEFALANIALARKHNYPVNLMPKLLARERSCRDKLDDGQSKGTGPFPRMDLNVSVNPKIPCVADGIRMKVYDEFGRGMVAERDFQAGTVILDEKAALAITTLETRYSHCGRCVKQLTYSLIPCPGCVSTLYCSEECLREDERFAHRFECAIADKIRNVLEYSSIVGPKLFFYGLTLFGDDLEAMMDYCKGASARGVGDPFKLDLRNNDRLEQFKELQKAGVHHITEVDHAYRISAAAMYVVFMKHPLVQQIVKTEAQREFMLHTFLKYIRNSIASMLDWREGGIAGPTVSMLPLLGTLCNHSCDPNAVFGIHSGRFKLAVIRPIRQGEQITSSYGPTWWEPNPDYDCTYKCRCPVCKHGGANWKLNEQELPTAAVKHLTVIRKGLEAETGVNKADLLNMAQQFVNRYAQYHPSYVFSAVLKAYRLFMIVGMFRAERNQERAQAMAALEENV